jgi:hypothetical protein
MSEGQRKHYRVCSVVCKEAWNLKRRTVLFRFNIGAALKLAWMTVRSMLPMHYSKVHGTTFNGRQALLKRLLQYDSKSIILFFEREPENEYDSNAIKIIAQVKSKGTAVIGYVSRIIAKQIAPLIDLGYIPIVIFEGVTGVSGTGNLGCNFKFCLIEK